jgi:hypothetical protein
MPGTFFQMFQILAPNQKRAPPFFQIWFTPFENKLLIRAYDSKAIKTLSDF